MRTALSAAGSAVGFGTVVGLPHFWHWSVTPAAAASTTKEVAQCEQANTMSLLGAGMEVVDPPAECIADNLAGDIPRNRRNMRDRQRNFAQCDNIALSATRNRSYWPYLIHLEKESVLVNSLTRCVYVTRPHRNIPC